MTIQATIESLLEKEIGLSAESIGSETIAKAIYRRTKACGFSQEKDYLNCLRTSDKELENLIEMAVIPETWFFRNKESFAFLARYVRTQWLTEKSDTELRILSIPCSTGEEPYSIAMTLMDTGLFNQIGKNRFYIEATDISNNALRKARLGIYGRESFRGKNMSFRERHFAQIPGPGQRPGPATREESHDCRWQINATVRNMIRFKKGNLVDEHLFPFTEKPFHIIFCRNLLIYLSESGKRRALENIEDLLTKDGILFLGHVERSFVCGAARKEQFSWIRRPGVFACQRTYPGSMTTGLRDSVPCLQGYPPLRNKKSGECAEHLKDDSSLSSEPTVPEKNECKSPLPNLRKSVSFHGQSGERPALSGDPGVSENVGPSLSPEPTTLFGNKGVPSPDVKKSNLLSKVVNGESSMRFQEAHAESFLDSAQKLADQGDLYEAMRECEKFLAVNTFHIQGHFLMGLICHALDDEDRAEVHFNKAVYLEPNHYEALSHLAFIMEHRGDKIRAAQMRQRAYRIIHRV